MMKARANNRIIFAMTLLYFVSSYISDTIPGGQLLTVFPLAVMIVVAIIAGKGVVRIRPIAYLLYIIAFIAFCALSMSWAEDPSLAIPKINSLLFILLAMIVIVICLERVQDIDMLLKVIMYGGYCVCLYIIFRYGWGGLLRIVSDQSRISNEMMNANALGLCASYALIINLHLILYRKVQWMDLLMLPALLILGVSGSRKAILVVIFGVVGILVLKNTDNKKMLKSIGKGILVLLGLGLLFFVLSRLSVFSVVVRRMNNLISLFLGNESRDSSDAWIRFAYNKLGLQLFSEHPVLGIGIANANIFTNLHYGHNHYLHNNFIELLACGGLVGFLLYYSAWIYLLITFVKCRRQRSKDYDICLVLLVVRLIMDYGQVTYYGKPTYIFLLLFWIEANKLRRERLLPAPVQETTLFSNSVPES